MQLSREYNQRRSTLFGENLITNFEWKEDNIFTTGIIFEQINHNSAVFALKFLLLTTFCPVNSEPKGYWLYFGASFLGIICAWIVDSYVKKYDFETLSATIILVFSVIIVVINIFDNSERTMFCPMARFGYAAILAMRATALSFFLEQVKFLKFGLDSDFMVFIVVWSYFFTGSLLTILYQYIIYLFGPVTFYFSVAVLATLFSMGKLIILLLISKRVFKPTIVLNVPQMVITFSSFRIRDWINDIAYQKERTQMPLMPFGVNLLSETFWKVARITIFSIPFGLSIQLVDLAWRKQMWTKMDDEYVYSTDFNAYYNFSSTALFPIFFFCVVRCGKSKWITTDLQQIGFGKLLVILSILYITVLNVKIQSERYPLPKLGYSQIRIFNMLGSPTFVKFRHFNGSIQPFGFTTFSRLNHDDTKMGSVIEVHNEDYGVDFKTSVFVLDGKSVCYYVDENGLMYLGPEPLPSVTSNKKTMLSPIIYFISSCKNIQIELKHSSGHSVQLTNDSLQSFLYVTIEEGSFEILVSYEDKPNVLSRESQFKLNYIYAVVIVNSTTPSERSLNVFTIFAPTVVATKAIIPAAAFLGLGNSIIIFSVIRFLLSDCPPQLYTILIACFYFLEHFILLIFSVINFAFFFEERSTSLYFALTGSLVFLIFYVYAAMAYKQPTFINTELSPPPTKTPRPTPESEEVSEEQF